MQRIGTFAKVDLTTFEVVARGQRLPRPVWGADAWLDPGANVPNCPKEFVGFGWWPEFRSADPVVDGHKQGVAVWQSPDQAEKCVFLHAPAVALSEADRKSEVIRKLNRMKADVPRIFSEKVAAGYEVSPGVRVGLSDQAFVTMQQAEDHLRAGGAPFYARTSKGDRLYVEDADSVAAIIAAMRSTYLGFVKREDELTDALESINTSGTSAQIQAEIDQHDVNAGWS